MATEQGDPQLSDKFTFPCGSCGASLTYKPGAENLECPYCGHAQAIPKAGGPVGENDFRDAILRARRVGARDIVAGGHTIRCEGCGAQTMISGQSDHCAFCGSPVVVAVEATDTLIIPDSVLPFAIDDRKARERFKEWVGSLWFAPGALAQRASSQGMDGVYLPYWTYDTRTTTRYTGQRGEHYYVEEKYTDNEGKQQTRKVQKTKWHPASGTVKVAFDDLLICGSTTLPDKLLEKLGPWDLKDLRGYEPAYLSGFVTERYAIDLEAGFERAKGVMKTAIQAAIERDIGGDEQTISTFDVRYADITFKHCLLPLWISSFRFGDKVYRFVVNARTGKVSGERPWSAGKITLLVLTIVAVIAVIVVLAQR